MEGRERAVPWHCITIFMSATCLQIFYRGICTEMLTVQFRYVDCVLLPQLWESFHPKVVKVQCAHCYLDLYVALIKVKALIWQKLQVHLFLSKLFKCKVLKLVNTDIFYLLFSKELVKFLQLLKLMKLLKKVVAIQSSTGCLSCNWKLINGLLNSF